MANLKLETHKLARELKKSGVDYEFLRHEDNDFGEASGRLTSVATIRGLYHESNAYISKSNGDYGVSRTKKEPRLLVLASDYIDSGIKMDDEVHIKQLGACKYQKVIRLTGVVDIGNWGLIVDLSFEEVDDGDNIY